MSRPPFVRIHCDDIVVDNFAGGGGASLGIEWAIGRSPDYAVNHDAEAIAMHEENHPNTIHLHSDVWEVDPVKIANGRRVALAWFSPDCKHFSRAKGGKPVSKNIRGLAWVVVRWAKEVKPRVICLENVAEFQTWGPLNKDGKPNKRLKGQTFKKWWAELEACGYTIEARELTACDYGAPTTRRRLFLVARCDGEPIRWPEPTHGPDTGRPFRSAAECIQWEHECPSIFTRKRPLADKTLARIARGIQQFVIETADPFIVPLTHAGDKRVHDIREPVRTITGANRGELALASPSLIQTGYGERKGQKPRTLDIDAPLGTIVAGGVKHALVAAFLARHYGGKEGRGGSGLDEAVSTITARDHHALVASHILKYKGTSTGLATDDPLHTVQAGGLHYAEVRSFLTKYYGTTTGSDMREPMHTVTSRDRFGLVTVRGTDYAIADVGMRMLQPRELYRAQGFPDSYVIACRVGTKKMTKTAQVKLVGNSVCPQLAEALVRANFKG